MFVGKKLCKEKKQTKQTRVKGTAQASERTLKNVLCLSQSKTPCFWIETKWQSWRSVVSDGAKTFFKLFSLRGGGHYLPCGFRLSSFPFFSFQSLVLVLGFTFCTSLLWWLLKCPFEKEHYFFIEIHFNN